VAGLSAGPGGRVRPAARFAGWPAGAFSSRARPSPPRCVRSRTARPRSSRS